jgi:hypothetical protein
MKGGENMKLGEIKKIGSVVELTLNKKSNPGDGGHNLGVKGDNLSGS